MSDETK